MIKKQIGKIRSFHMDTTTLSPFEKKAIKIAEEWVGKNIDYPEDFHLHWSIQTNGDAIGESQISESIFLFNCWIITCPWYDGLDGRILRPPRVIAITRNTKKIIMDSAVSPLLSIFIYILVSL